MTRPSSPKLGRGLSSLIGSPVSVSVPSGTRGPQPPDPVRTEESSVESTGVTVTMVDLATCIPNKYQPRTSFDATSLSALADSIRQTGVMQPILVRRQNAGESMWEIVAGERRWRAAKLAGLQEIPAIAVDVDERSAAEWAIIENVQREDLNAMDRAWAYRKLAEKFSLMHAEIAERVGVDRSSVTNLIRLTELEPEIQRMIADGKISGGHGRALLAAPAGAPRMELANRAVGEGWSVRRLERAAGSVGTAPPEKPSTRTATGRDADLRELERQLSDHLGTKVQVQTEFGGERGRLTISFYTLDQFDGLMHRLGFMLK